jgi:hypothetical protein
MARNFSFLKSKKFWVLCAAGVTGLFAVLFFQAQRGDQGPLLLLDGRIDSIPPATAITSPEDRTWHNAGFSVAIRDSDIGVGLAPFVSGKQGCLYRIEDFGADTVFGDFRKCGTSEISISIGKDQACSSSYAGDSSRGKCRVSTKSIDRAGNESEWKSSLFFIDTERPIVGSVVIELGSLETGYMLSGEVVDNGKIVSCWVARNEQVVHSQVSFDFLPCQEGRRCSLTAQYVPQDADIHTVRFGCKDAAGNVGYGEPLSSLSFINQAPTIELCKVAPSQGNTSTMFQFESTAQDPNQDALSFIWDFGDGAISQDQSPSHRYVAPGTYTPKLTVHDPAGKTDECSTAWVIVGE